MARLYADERFPREAVELLRNFGHDVLTVQEAGKANQKIPDESVLAFAASEQRAVLTLNRFDFVRLHRQNSNHAGIIACSENPNSQRLGAKINEAIAPLNTLEGQLIRIYRDQS